jgi:hypothetical protein
MNYALFGLIILAVAVIGPHLLRYLLLKTIGGRALKKTPDRVMLIPVAAPRWLNPALIEQHAAPLLREGFTDLGGFRAEPLEGVMLRLLANCAECVTASIYDHPRAGCWIEMVTHYADGRAYSLTTLSPTGLQEPPWLQTTRVPAGSPTDELYRKLLRERPANGISSLTPARVVPAFEEAYARYIGWKKSGNLSAGEVANVAQKRARAKAAAASQAE